LKKQPKMQEFKIQLTEESQLKNIDFENLPFGRIFTDHMLEIDYSDGHWQTPQISPVHTLNLHPANLSLHYGQLIFEGMKATKSLDGKPILFRPEMHSIRLNKSAERLCMPTLPEELFIQSITKFVSIESNWIPPKEGSALYLRPFMMATDEFLGVTPSTRYKFIIIACPVGPYYANPVKLLAQKEFVRAIKGGVGEAKAAGNYAAAMLPAKIAREKGYDQVLWLDGKNFEEIHEVGTMNIFFVIKDKVITPATQGAILKGITRDSVLHILKAKGYSVEERSIGISEVFEAYQNGTLQEVFGTGTAAVISTVEKIHFEGQDIELDTQQYVIAPMVKSEINGLRSGRLKDSFGWTRTID
jgi:branched-chain amino acid aminotransferase